MVSDIEGAVFDADTKIVVYGDNVIKLEDLLVPEFSTCRRCPITGNCPAEESSRKEGHCLIEEGLIIEATKDLMNYYDITIRDKLTMFSFLINLLHLHRLSRMGSRIDYGLFSEDNFDIMNKYMAMLAKIDGRYHKGLTELQATRKEQMKIRQLQTEETGNFINIMTDLARKTKQKKRDELLGTDSSTDN